MAEPKSKAPVIESEDEFAFDAAVADEITETDSDDE